MRFIGHRDLMRCFERLFRRAGLALSFSEGFHPKPRLTFPLALAVGIEGADEVMEVELAAPIAAEELRRRASAQAPSGLTIRSVEVLPEGSRKARVDAASYEASIPDPADRAGLDERIARLLAASTWLIERAPGRAPIDLRPLLVELSLSGETLRMRLRVDERGSAGPRDVLAALGLADVERRAARLRRTAVELQP